MKTNSRSVQKIIEEQVQRWRYIKLEKKIDEKGISVPLVNMQNL